MSKPHVLLLAFLSLSLFSCKKDGDQLMNPSNDSNLEKSIKKDKEAPSINLLSPVDQSAVWNTDLTVEVSDNLGLERLDIYEDGQLIRTCVAPSNGKAVTFWHCSWDYNPGIWDVRTLKAVATDLAGNIAERQITVYKLIQCCPAP